MFLLVFGTMLAIAHGYVWFRVVRNPRWSAPVRAALTAFLAIGWIGILAGLVVWRGLHGEKTPTWIVAAFVWLGAVFHLTVFLAAWDMLRSVAWVAFRVRRRDPAKTASRGVVRGDPGASDAAPSGSSVGGRDRFAAPDDRLDDAALDRRAFLARVAALTAGVATGGVVTAGMYSARRELHTPEVVVRLARLPRQLDGFRIVQICDMHLGPLLDESFARRIVKRVNELKPDLVAIVGDLVDGTVEQLERDVRPLAELTSRCGTYYVTGNHEYYSGVRPWLEYLPRLGIRVLANERVSVGDPSPGGSSFDLAGIHDPAGRRLDPRNASDISAVIAGRNTDRELVLLAHQPVQVADAVAAGAGLQLSGHTHGGQLWPFGAMVLLAQPYIAGLHRHTPHMHVYVSRGTGFWGPPMRVLAPAEITQVVLTAG